MGSIRMQKLYMVNSFLDSFRGLDIVLWEKNPSCSASIMSPG